MPGRLLHVLAPELGVDVEVAAGRGRPRDRRAARARLAVPHRERDEAVRRGGDAATGRGRAAVARRHRGRAAGGRVRRAAARGRLRHRRDHAAAPADPHERHLRLRRRRLRPVDPRRLHRAGLPRPRPAVDAPRAGGVRRLAREALRPAGRACSGTPTPAPASSARCSSGRPGSTMGAAIRELVGYERLGLTHTWQETVEPEPADLPPLVASVRGRVRRGRHGRVGRPLRRRRADVDLPRSRAVLPGAAAGRGLPRGRRRSRR